MSNENEGLLQVMLAGIETSNELDVTALTRALEEVEPGADETPAVETAAPAARTSNGSRPRGGERT